MVKMLSRKQQGAALVQLLGKDRVVRREANYSLRDEKGKLQKDRMAEHAVEILEQKLPQCVALKVGVGAFGKGASADVDPAVMNGLKDAECAEAVAAAHPKLAVKTAVTSAEATFTNEATGQILSQHIGDVNGCDEIAAARIEAAAVTGLYGKQLDQYLSKLLSEESTATESEEDNVEEPANEPVNS